MDTHPARDIEPYRQLIRPVLADAAPGLRDPAISFLCQPKAVADDVTKLLVRDAGGRPRCVAMVAAPADPHLVRRGADRARLVRERLGPDLGAAVLLPLAEGEADGRSYAVYPYCKPAARAGLAAKLQAPRLRPLVTGWLAAATEATARPADPQRIPGAFREPLEQLAANPGMAAPVRAAAERALGRLASGAWQPRHAVMHGDFWLGNVLFTQDPARTDRFRRIAIIDWPGASTEGYGLYDLVRLAMSMKLSPGALRAQAARHARALGCDPGDARSHLVAALADLGTHLGHFPPDRYAALAARCLETLDRAVPH